LILPRLILHNGNSEADCQDIAISITHSYGCEAAMPVANRHELSVHQGIRKELQSTFTESAAHLKGERRFRNFSFPDETFLVGKAPFFKQQL
jgi:hypothetical protein